MRTPARWLLCGLPLALALASMGPVLADGSGAPAYARPTGALQAAPVRVGARYGVTPYPAATRSVRPVAPPPAQVVVQAPQVAAPCEDPCATRWSLALAGGMALHEAPDGLLGVQAPPSGSAIEWSSLDYPATLAGRGSLSCRAGARWGIALQGTYWGQADDDATVSGTYVSRRSAGGLTDVSRPLQADLTSELTLWDAGAGVWFELASSPRFAFLAGLGVRVASLEETSRMGFATTDVGATPPEDGWAQAEVQNDMLLGEAMLGMRWSPSASWAFTVAVTGLLGGVSTDVRVSDEDVFSGGVHAGSLTDDDTVHGAQLDLLAQWRLSRGWSLTAGYSLLWLDGVQRGPRALDFGQSDTGAVQAAYEPGTYTAHAVLLGVAIDF